MANKTKGSITSDYPDSLPSFTAQSELLDPAAEDSTLAEGRDANKWSAEMEAITECLGAGGRAQVSVSGSTATIEILEYVFQGTQVSYAGTTVLSLFASQVNYIYLDCEDNIAKVSTSSWPSTPHLRLAIWDDSGASVTLADERPHDLRPAASSPILGTTLAQYLDSGSATVTDGNTYIDITFTHAFSVAPYLVWGARRPSDSNLREVNATNVTTTGARLHIDTAAPATGCVINWIAIGTKDLSGTGS